MDGFCCSVRARIHRAQCVRRVRPVCQMNVELCQDQINRKYGTKFDMPVAYYSTSMSVAYGKSAKESRLDGHVIRAKKLEQIAAK